MSVFSKIKNKIFGVKESTLDRRIETFKLVAANNKWIFKGNFELSGKLVFENKDIKAVINLTSGDVVTTSSNGRKLKRVNLSDSEIIEVLKNPKIKIMNKAIKWIDN